MKKHLTILGLAALALSTASCAVRDAEMYAADTANVVVTRNPQIKTCYDEALKADQSAAGAVVVSFTVEKKTGNIIDAALVKERTTAPEALGQCVVNAMQGLVLDPPDRNEGAAIFTWNFQPNAPVQLEAEAPAAAAPGAPPAS